MHRAGGPGDGVEDQLPSDGEVHTHHHENEKLSLI